MSMDLQLADYTDGYRFRLNCRHCGNGWYEEPANLVVHPLLHSRMYLVEIEQALVCRGCRSSKIKVTPIILKPTHHFVGGLG